MRVVRGARPGCCARSTRSGCSRPPTCTSRRGSRTWSARNARQCSSRLRSPFAARGSATCSSTSPRSATPRASNPTSPSISPPFPGPRQRDGSTRSPQASWSPSASRTRAATVLCACWARASTSTATGARSAAWPQTCGNWQPATRRRFSSTCSPRDCGACSPGIPTCASDWPPPPRSSTGSLSSPAGRAPARQRRSR